MSRFMLRLYVMGRTPPSQRAIANLRNICAAELKDRCEIEVVDILESPALAEMEKILATPTLVRRRPEPIKKIIGDLSDREKVLFGLDLDQAESGEADVQE